MSKHLKTERYELHICVDCLVYFANNDLPPLMSEENAMTFMAKVEHMVSGGDIMLDDSDDMELGFSWSWCQTCGDRLGGDRFRAFIDLPVMAEEERTR